MSEHVHTLHPSLWENLLQANPDDVCRRSGAQFDSSTNSYLLDFLLERYRIHPRNREFEPLTGPIPPGGPSIDLKVTIITYLLSAKAVPLAGKLVSGSNLKGGMTFFQGVHRLPIEPLMERYGKDPEDFLTKGLSLGATQEAFGDVGLRFPALPRVPVFMVLWAADEEFPARLNVLFDASIEQHLPLDAIYGLVSEICYRMRR